MKVTAETITDAQIGQLHDLAQNHPGAIDGNPEYVAWLCQRALDSRPGNADHKERLARIWNKYLSHGGEP